MTWLPHALSSALGLLALLCLVRRPPTSASAWLARGQESVVGVGLLTIAPWPLLLGFYGLSCGAKSLLPIVFLLLLPGREAISLWRIRVVEVRDGGLLVRGWRESLFVRWEEMGEVAVDRVLPCLSLRLGGEARVVRATVSPGLVSQVLVQFPRCVPASRLDPLLRDSP